MRKISQINEGFWKDSIKRAKDNTERIEDHIPDSNVYDLKEVDLGLPFYVADKTLTLNGSAEIRFKEFEYDGDGEKINKLGWRIPTENELRLILNEGTITRKVVNIYHYYILEKDGKEIVMGPHHGLDTFGLWCEFNKKEIALIAPMFFLEYNQKYNKINIVNSTDVVTRKHEILLVKDKKE